MKNNHGLLIKTVFILYYDLTLTKEISLILLPDYTIVLKFTSGKN